MSPSSSPANVYRTLFEYAPDGIVIADPQSYYIDANPSICRMLGYTRDELIGLHASDIVAPAEVQNIAPALRAIKATTDYVREWQFRRKDGSTFSADVMVTAMPDGNLLAMIRDLTERRKLEQQFLRAQRMESIGTLAGGIAHDLNNVLAPILLSLDVLRDHITDDAALESLAALKRSALRGAALVQQVLSFARGVEGQRIPVSPFELIRDVLTVVRDTFPKSIEVDLRGAPDVRTVTGDPTQLHQVLLNLCLNARDSMPDGGRLSIGLENVVVDDTYAAMNLDCPPGVYVLMTVTDTGTGIPPEIRERIFEPFFTTKETGKGTGLGLSTSHAIVGSHGGVIHVYSEMGTGTTFKVYLPADASKPAAAPVPAERVRLPRGNGETVLVVDDEEAIRHVARRTLERYGYRVLLAANGAEGVDVYATHRSEVAVVLTDMAMPVMDGPATILALKAMNPAVSIIGSSGFASSGGVAEALRAGVKFFVPKPYTTETLLNTIQQALREATEP